MSDPQPQTLLQAAIHRLGARLGSGMVDAAANLALLAQDAPARAQQELQLFWEEVQREAERLERGEAGDQGAAEPAAAGEPAPVDLQDQIDRLRARVAGLSRQLDGRP